MTLSFIVEWMATVVRRGQYVTLTTLEAQGFSHWDLDHLVEIGLLGRRSDAIERLSYRLRVDDDRRHGHSGRFRRMAA